MDAGLIARRYATVLHDFAADKGVLDTVFDDAVAIRQILAQQPEALEFFLSPVRKPSEKKQLIKAVFENCVAIETLQFLSFLVDKERIGLVGSILFVFESLVKKEKNICSAVITTAKDLAPEQKSRIVEHIADKLRNSGRTVSAVDASFKVCPAIIGGLILEVDGMQLDNSVQSKLMALQKSLSV